MNKQLNTGWMSVLALMLVGGCATAPQQASRPVTYQDVSSAGIVSGVGVESQDIVSVSDTMVRDLLADPQVMKMARAPRRVALDPVLQQFVQQCGRAVGKRVEAIGAFTTGGEKLVAGGLIIGVQHFIFGAAEEIDRDGHGRHLGRQARFERGMVAVHHVHLLDQRGVLRIALLGFDGCQLCLQRGPVAFDATPRIIDTELAIVVVTEIVVTQVRRRVL